ncbi:MAG: DUF4131 domain-containing protein, partial [Candidatus Hydrogenedentes bacterium]|nr:DUF4131 domain-containing protein [Candidatus Hydrogenedentota bacterium]
MDRPLVWIAAGLTLGMFAAAFGAAWFVGALALLTGLLAAAMRNHFAYRQHFIFGIVFYSLGGLVWGLEHRQAAGDALSRYSRAHPLEELGLEGEVRQAPVFASERGYATFILAVDYVATPHGAVFAPGRLLVRWTDPAPVHSGERVRVRGKIGHRLGPVNHGVRGYEDYLRTQGVHSEIRVRGPALERLSVPVWSPYYWVSRLRTAEARALQRAVP